MELLGIFALELMKHHLIPPLSDFLSIPRRRGCRTPASGFFPSLLGPSEVQGDAFAMRFMRSQPCQPRFSQPFLKPFQGAVRFGAGAQSAEHHRQGGHRGEHGQEAVQQEDLTHGSPLALRVGLRAKVVTNCGQASSNLSFRRSQRPASACPKKRKGLLLWHALSSRSPRGVTLRMTLISFIRRFTYGIPSLLPVTNVV